MPVYRTTEGHFLLALRYRAFLMIFLHVFHNHIPLLYTHLFNVVSIYLNRLIIRSLMDNNLFSTCRETKATQEKLVSQDEE